LDTLNEDRLLGVGILPGTKAEPKAPASWAASTELNLPARLAGARAGKDFISSTVGSSYVDREQAIFTELSWGNVPPFLRKLREVTLTATDGHGIAHTGIVKVTPDYLSIGTDEDFVWMPMNPMTAQRIADLCGCILPTRKLVDAIYAQATLKLVPQPKPPVDSMMSSEYYLDHNEMVEQQRGGRPLAQLTAGHKKDVVIARRLVEYPDRVAIYGWHQPGGQAIQPLSTVHENTYADYSHGIRLVLKRMLVDGKEVDVEEVLRDPDLCSLLSDEGTLASARVPHVPAPESVSPGVPLIMVDSGQWEDFIPAAGAQGEELPVEVLAKIQAERALFTKVSLKATTTMKGGHFYMGSSEHVTYVKNYLDTKAKEPNADARKVNAFKSLQGKEGSTSAINTYDNQIVTWGTGWGGAQGLLGKVMAKVTEDPKVAGVFHQCGFRYAGGPAGKNIYHVVDLATRKVVSGTAAPLQVVRGTEELLYMLVHVAEDPATRDAVIDAQLTVFEATSAHITQAEAIFTQALFDFIVHLKHWAPGYVVGAVEWAVAKAGGAKPASVEQDLALAPWIGEYFYRRANTARANNATAWIPSWLQFKSYWKFMIDDGGPALEELVTSTFVKEDKPPSKSLDEW
jgi:hypothetical protein